jgi:transposase
MESNAWCPRLTAAMILSGGAPFTEAHAGASRHVEIEFATGGRMRITGSVDASTVSALIKALAKSKRRR